MQTKNTNKQVPNNSYVMFTFKISSLSCLYTQSFKIALIFYLSFELYYLTSFHLLTDLYLCIYLCLDLFMFGFFPNSLSLYLQICILKMLTTTTIQLYNFQKSTYRYNVLFMKINNNKFLLIVKLCGPNLFELVEHFI